VTHQQFEPRPRAAAPYPVEPGERRPIDPRRPWLEAGRSHDALANRLLTYHRTHGRLLERIFLPLDVHRFRDRGRACRKHARTLDRLTAHGWVTLHDRAVLGTREVLDHVLVGPGGVAVLFTIPAIDRDPAGQPGPRTGLELDAAIGRWVMHTQPRLKDLLTERLNPGWVVHTTAASSSPAPTGPTNNSTPPSYQPKSSHG
jgi:hypothetical protein